MNYILTTIFVLLMIHSGCQRNEIKSLKAQLETAKQDVQDAEDSAYQDCQRFMSSNQRIQRINGCYAILELMCSETKKPVTCMDMLLPRCGEIGDE